MTGVLTIDSFHAQLTALTEDTLLKAVREVMALEHRKLSEILVTQSGWTGWYV